MQASFGIYRLKPKDKACLAGNCVITLHSLGLKKYTKHEKVINEYLG
jgi:hypothetical protein